MIATLDDLLARTDIADLESGIALMSAQLDERRHRLQHMQSATIRIERDCKQLRQLLDRLETIRNNILAGQQKHQSGEQEAPC